MNWQRIESLVLSSSNIKCYYIVPVLSVLSKANSTCAGRLYTGLEGLGTSQKEAVLILGAERAVAISRLGARASTSGRTAQVGGN